MKNKFEWTVWIPIVGVLFMFYFTEFGRYDTSFFAGYIWGIYQFSCTIVFYFGIIYLLIK